MHPKNQIINKLLDEKKITQDEYNILFCSKKEYLESKEKTKKFNKIFQKIVSLQEQNHENKINLSYIYFPPIDFSTFEINWNKSISFRKSKFYGETFFSSIKFESLIDFIGSIFYGKSNFINTNFNNSVFFVGTKFYDDTTFERSIFNHVVRFLSAEFHTEISFHATIFNKFSDFSEITFQQIDLSNIELYNAGLLGINGYENNKLVSLTKTNFMNKESARILKAHFEKQNNITEANKYFAIEQELYIDELNRTKTEPNRIPTLATLYLNKCVSNFGTDWIRSLFFLFTLSYLFMRLYIDLDSYLGTDEHIKHVTKIADIQYIWTMLVSWGLIYLSTFFKSDKFIFWSLILVGVIIGIVGVNTYDNVLAMQNYIIQLTNPINAFKNMNLYDGIEVYGAIVRITVVTIMYQFIVAFRQNTRRK